MPENGQKLIFAPGAHSSTCPNYVQLIANDVSYILNKKNFIDIDRHEKKSWNRGFPIIRKFSRKNVDTLIMTHDL